MVEDPQSERKLCFDEFKLFYESTEKVTDRRLAANTWNYSICTAILVAVAAIANWGLSKPGFFLVSAIAMVLLSSMAALFCTLWIGQIRDFKSLNKAKFEVLNDMAPHVIFGDRDSDPRVSFCPFEKEWRTLERLQAVQQVSDSKIVALKSSNMEYLIPRAFRLLYLLLIIAVLGFSILNWKVMVNSSQLVVGNMERQEADIK